MPKKEVIAGILGVLVAIVLIVWSITNQEFLTGIAAELNGYSLLVVLLMSAIAASAVSVTFIPIPYYVVVFDLAGILSPEWGLVAPVLVGIVSATGNTLGQLPTFMIGYGGKKISKRLASRFGEQSYLKITEWIKKHGSIAVFLVSAVPNPLHLPLTLASGTMKFPPGRWCFFTLMGNLFKNLVIAFIGYFVFNKFM